MLGNRFHCVLTAISAVGLSGLAHGAVLVNFDGQTGLDKFNIPSGNGFSYQNTGNIIGDYAIKPTADGKATYNASTFGLAVDQSITVSMKFTKTAPSGNGLPIIQLGFGDVSLDTFNNSTIGYNTVYARALVVDSSLSAATYKLVSDNKLTTNTVASEASPNGTGTFVIANPGGNPFYQFNVTLTRTGATTFTQAASLSLLDATDKSTPISTIASFAPQALTNAGLAAAADGNAMYAGFRGTVSSGVLRMEDFAVSDAVNVPEPASVAILAGIAGVGLRRRRYQK